MRTMTNKILTSLILMFFVASVCSVAFAQDGWNVPEKFKTTKNPVKADDASKNLGKTLYMKNCMSCHGKTGAGDGPKAKTLSTAMEDLGQAKYQSLTDGEQFYKTKTGKGEMPKYDKKIPDEDIWNIINYMRTFKK